jgi:glycosyltransferase involved in cell wall biosynthesis
MERKNKVSVVILTLNEEKNLHDCLETVKWADEIIIVDSFSTDKTVEIAKKFKCKVFQKKFDGFGQLKNYAISQTSHNWVLNLDADERITETLRKEIEEVLKDPKFDGYYFPRKSYVGKRWIRRAGQYPSYQLRLFRKDKGSFENSVVHERARVAGTTGHMKNYLIHYNFRSWSDYIIDMNRVSSLEAKEMLKKKFVWFYPFKKVREFFREYSKLRKNGNSRKVSYVLARKVLMDYEIKWLLPFRFITTFIRMYVFQQGFRDGVYGFIWCYFVSMHKLVKLYKYYELKHGLEIE